MKLNNIRLRPFWLGGFASTIFFGMQGIAYAQTIPNYSYQSFLGLFESSPTKIESEAASEASKARVQQATARANPQLGIEVENFAGTAAPYGGLSNVETTFTVSQDLELYGRRTARTNVARAFSNAASLQTEIRRLEYANNLAKLFVEVEGAQRSRELLQAQLALATEDLRIVSILIEGGREPLLRRVQAETDLAKIKSEFLEAENDVNIALLNLKGFLNYSSEINRIDGSLLGISPKISANFNIEKNPSYRALLSQIDANKYQIEEARTDARPNASAYFGARNFNGANATAFVGGVNVVVPFFNRNSGNISAAIAERRASEARLTSFILGIESQRRANIAKLSSISQKLGALDIAVSSAEEAYRMSKIGFQAGRINLIEVQSARTSLFEFKRLIITTLLERARIEADLALIEGRIPFGAAQ